MDDNLERAARIAQVVALLVVKTGLLEREIAQRIGIDPTTLSKSKKTGRLPGQALLALEREFPEYGVDAQYLMYGEGRRQAMEAEGEQLGAEDVGAVRRILEEMLRSARGDRLMPAPDLQFVLPDSEEAIAAGVVRIPLVDRFGPGGTFVADSIKGYLVMDKQFGLEGGQLVMIRNVGDEMSPTLHDGAIIVVDQDRKGTSALAGRLVCVRQSDGTPVIRRLRCLEPSPILCPDNAAHPLMLLTPDELADRLIGQVVWGVQDLR